MNSFKLIDIVQRRAGHVLVTYKEELYMWGGYMEEEDDRTSQYNSYFHNSNEVWIYFPLLNIWKKQICTGVVPCKLSGSSAGVIDHYMYVFGGFSSDDFNEPNKNSLWQLDLISFVWTLIVAKGFQPFACDKCASWVYRDRFYIFGGYGPSIYERGKAPSNVIYETEFETSKGWLDQLVYYDASKNCWTWPIVGGLKPSPRAAHAAAVLNKKAFIFGGRHKENRLNDFHCLDLDIHHWTNVQLNPNSPIPRERSWHTLTTISEDKILLYGGFSSNCEVLNDAWIFLIESMTWEQIPSCEFSKRLWHCAAVVLNCEILFVGGISNNILNYAQPRTHAKDMLKIKFSPPPLFNILLEYITNCKKINRKSWTLLPVHIKKILEMRTDPLEVHGIQSK